MIEARTRPPTAQATRPEIVAFGDGIGVWTDRRESRSGGTPRSRLGKVRRRWVRCGLEPGPIIDTPWGASLFSGSLAPIWNNGTDLERRALGQPPQDCQAVLEALERREIQATRRGYRDIVQPLARITRVDLALDVLGIPVWIARRLLMPSLDDHARDERDDLIRVPNWRTLRRGRGRLHGAWQPGKTGHEAVYSGPKSRGRVLVVYDDRPSKLDPEGPPVLHFDQRLRGSVLPQEVRDDPFMLLPYLSPLGIWRLLGRHLEFGPIS